MKLDAAVRLGVRVLLSLAGVLVGLAVLLLSPGGCGRGAVQLAWQPAPPVRVSVALRVPAAPLVRLGPGSWQLVQVVRVVDADTYEVQVAAGRAHVRLLGVDAPEADQPGGARATDSVRALVLRRYVWVRVAGVDLYGRALVAVRLRPAAFAGPRTLALDSVLVVRGWAWAFDPTHAVAGRAGLQQQAQAARRGIWRCGTMGVVAPKIWRSYAKTDKARAWVGCPW